MTVLAAAAVAAGMHPASMAPGGFPLITGMLRPGDAQTVLMNNMYLAPLFGHAPRPCDFLLILQKQTTPPCAPIPTDRKRTGRADGGGVPGKSDVPASEFVGILREITSLFVAGQLEPLTNGVVRCRNF